jgi:uncharacterized membrane protein YtjA (UPF0391 family)
MLSWSLVFFIMAIVSSIIGFSRILPGENAKPHIEQVCRDVVVYTGGSIGSDVAKIMFVVFVILFLVSLIAGLLQRP